MRDIHKYRLKASQTSSLSASTSSKDNDEKTHSYGCAALHAISTAFSSRFLQQPCSVFVQYSQLCLRSNAQLTHNSNSKIENSQKKVPLAKLKTPATKSNVDDRKCLKFAVLGYLAAQAIRFGFCVCCVCVHGMETLENVNTLIGQHNTFTAAILMMLITMNASQSLVYTKHISLYTIYTVH